MPKTPAPSTAADTASNPAPAPAPSAPIGTPPHGGRWCWDGAQWLPLDEPTPPADAAPTTATE